MAILFGSELKREELLQRVGDISQIARIKPYCLVEGHEDGVKALDVTNGSGLQFSVLASRGLDISTATYNGQSLAWRSAMTDQHPAFFDSSFIPLGFEFGNSHSHQGTDQSAGRSSNGRAA